MGLTTNALWDDMWTAVELPVVVDPTDPYAGAIVSTIESYLPSSSSTVIELGGAPGGYLAYFARHGLFPVALEQSEVGCAKTLENWRLLGIQGTVIHGDIFQPTTTRYDIVYSLGLIEHFDDLNDVVGHHLKFLKPGGTIVLGCPNFRGVYRRPLHWLAPERLRVHNLSTMKAKNWDGFESAFGLTRLFRGYVGGFEPRLLLPTERSGAVAGLLARSAGACSKALRLPLIRKAHSLNHPVISGYLLGIYRFEAGTA